MMDDLERTHKARDEFDQFMGTFPSKAAVQNFLFVRANHFMVEKCDKHNKTGEVLVGRKKRRLIARQIAKRLTKAAKAGAEV